MKKTPKSSLPPTLQRLTRTLEREKRKNARLRRTVSHLRREVMKYHLMSIDTIRTDARGTAFWPVGPKRPDLFPPREQMLLWGVEHAQNFRRASFFLYLWATAKQTRLVHAILRFFLYLRRFRVWQTVVTVVLALLATAVVSAVYVTALPFFLMITGSTLMISFFRSRKMNGHMQKLLRGKQVRIMIPTHASVLQPSSFFAENAKDMVRNDPRVVVLVITPHLLSNRGIGGQGMFFTARREDFHIYLIRTNYFFFLRKHVLDALDRPPTMIY